METHAPDGIEWLLELPAADRGLLAAIRHWPGLRVASQEGSLWIAGLSEARIRAAEIRSLPAKNVWRKQSGDLFRDRNLVPSRKMPALLWSPIARGLPVELPAWNHTYAATNERLRPRLIRDSSERHPTAMTVQLKDLAAYIETAPSARLKKLHWCVLAPDRALLYGVPLLPLDGETFWLTADFLIPSGFDFEYPELIPAIAARLQAPVPSFLLWAENSSCCAIPKSALTQLSIGSLRQTSILTHR